MTPITYADLEKARQAIAPYIIKTPFVPSEFISRAVQKEIYLKCEMLQFTGSFKLRGATNCVLANLATAKKAGVVAASAGNHAQGVAAICQKLGIRSTIVMPNVTPTLKVQNTKRYGAEVQLVGEVYDESYEHAMELSRKHGYLFVHPFRDPLVIAGQGSVALEMLEEPQFAGIEAVVCSVGGGGILSGVATALRAKRPDIKIYGITARNAPSVWHSYKTKTPQSDPVTHTLAEGVATKKAEAEMVQRLNHLVDDMFQISEEAIAHAISLLAEHSKMVVEGAGALPLAAVLEHLIPEKKVALILSGGNIDLFALSAVMQRGLVEQGRLVRLDVTVSDRPGGLAVITDILAKEKANIHQVFHQRESLRESFGQTRVEFLLETRGEDHTQHLLTVLKERGFPVQRSA